MFTCIERQNRTSQNTNVGRDTLQRAVLRYRFGCAVLVLCRVASWVVDTHGCKEHKCGFAYKVNIRLLPCNTDQPLPPSSIPTNLALSIWFHCYYCDTQVHSQMQVLDRFKLTDANTNLFVINAKYYLISHRHILDMVD